MSIHLRAPCAVVALLIVCSPVQAQVQFPAPFPSHRTKVAPATIREFLGLICPNQVRDGEIPSCPCSNGAPDELTIESVLFKHLLGPSSNDALVGTLGCEARVATYGGRVLFTKTGGGWTVSRPYSYGRVGWCRRVETPDGTDGLLCFNEDHWAEGTDAGWLTFRLETEPERDSPELVRVTENVEAACRAAYSQRKKQTAIRSRIEGVVVSEAPSGQVAMTVQATCGRAFLPLRARKACEAGELPPNGGHGINLGVPLKRYRISYILRAGQFVPTASGKAAAAALHQCIEPDIR